MDLANIYVHDGVLLRVIEDTDAETVTMEALLPVDPDSDDFAPGQLVFESVLRYQVVEGACEGRPVILDINVVGDDEGLHRVRIDTNHGYRELSCSAVKLIHLEAKAEPDTGGNR